MLFQYLSRQRRDRGFSFIELLAYMAIAALLILAAVPQFSAYRERALISNLQNDVHNASLAAEASLIASKSGGMAPGVMQLASTASDGASAAPAPGTFAALSAAVKATKLSDSASTLVTIDTGAGEYEIRGTNPKTKRMVVFASAMNGASGFEQGLSLVDASDAPALPSEPGAGGVPPVQAKACSVPLKDGAPAARITSADFSGATVMLSKNAVTFNLKQDLYATPKFPYTPGGRDWTLDATGLRMWLGDTELCLADALSPGVILYNGSARGDAATTQPYVSGQAMSYGKEMLTDAEVAGRAALTAQFQYEGSTHVVRMDWSPSWNTVDEPIYDE